MPRFAGVTLGAIAISIVERQVLQCKETPFSGGGKVAKDGCKRCEKIGSFAIRLYLMVDRRFDVGRPVPVKPGGGYGL